jgi:hypothetical protein
VIWRQTFLINTTHTSFHPFKARRSFDPAGILQPAELDGACRSGPNVAAVKRLKKASEKPGVTRRLVRKYRRAKTR